MKSVIDPFYVYPFNLMDQLTNQLQQLTIDTTVKKHKHTAYWGIELQPSSIDHPLITRHLTDRPELIPLKSIHSTLLFVGKKPDNPDEDKYFPLQDLKCQVNISSFGVSDDAMALKVDSIKLIDQQASNSSQDVPSHASTQHVTFALKDGIKAVNSIRSFDHTMVALEQPIMIIGKIKRYMY